MIDANFYNISICQCMAEFEFFRGIISMQLLDNLYETIEIHHSTTCLNSPTKLNIWFGLINLNFE